MTFGDPDFFNGIRHADDVVRGFAREFPDVTYDVTIKVEHLLRHAEMLGVLRETGCAFVTTAVESVDDRVLAKLEKGHTRADFERVVGLCRDSGLSLAPTFMPFTPWTTLQGYLDLLHVIERLDLVEHVSPIQLVIRLLIPQGSRMLELDDVRRATAAFDARSLTYPWTHADPAVDELQAELTELVGLKLSSPRRDVFAKAWDLATIAPACARCALRRRSCRAPQFRTSTNLGTVERSRPQSSWLCYSGSRLAICDSRFGIRDSDPASASRIPDPGMID